MAKSNKFFGIIILSVFLCNPPAEGRQYAFRNYRERSGLPNPVVRCIFQDSRGYLWLGLEKGLSRFDGIKFTIPEKAGGWGGDGVNTITEDRRGSLWIGLDKGMLSYTPDRGFEERKEWSLLAGKSVYAIQEDDAGRLWIGTSNGLFTLDISRSSLSEPSQPLPKRLYLSIAIEKPENIWLGTDQGLLLRQGKTWIDYSGTPVDGHLFQLPVIALTCDASGSLWVGSRKGLIRLAGGRAHHYTTAEGLSHDAVNSIMEAPNGDIWIGTWEGVSRISGGAILNLTTRNGLPDNFIYAITADREGNIWFGTHGGAACLTSLSIQSFSKNDGLAGNQVTDIIETDEGAYWFGTTEGLSSYANGQFRTYTTRDGLIADSINGLMADRQGKIWIATFQGLSVFKNGAFFNYTTRNGLAGNVIFKIAESRDGAIWIRHRGGFTRWLKGHFSSPLFGLEKNDIHTFMTDSRGDLWFASSEALRRFSGDNLTSFPIDEKQMGKSIHVLYENSQKQFWLGADAGLFRFDNGKFIHIPFNAGSTTDTACHFILEDSHGWLWTGNSTGLFVWNGKTFTQYRSRRLGLTDRTWVSGMRDHRGFLWFGSSEGAVVFLPPPTHLNNTPPPVYITDVKNMERTAPLDSGAVWPHNRNIFRFSFIGISFTNPEEVSFKYQMDNLGKEWLTTRDHSLFFPFLPPGSYNLKIKAVNADGVESIQPAEYRFTIRPPFWETWWFKALVFFGFTLSLFFFIKGRIRRVHLKAEENARKKELELKNRQLVISQRMELMGALAAGAVHDLKNLLAVIIGYSREIDQEAVHDETSRRHVQIIKETAATAVQLVKQILSFARPRACFDELCDLGAALSEILETLKIMQPANIAIDWRPPEQPVLFPIQPSRFQQLVMNLCINAFQAMPEGGRLAVSLDQNGKSAPPTEMTLSISDTGDTAIPPENLEKIFDPLFTTKEHGEGAGLGLFVVKQIVEDYKGRITVQSINGQGTTFTICFPVSPQSNPDNPR